MFVGHEVLLEGSFAMARERLVWFSLVAAVARKPPGSTWAQLFTVTDGMSGEDSRAARATTRTRTIQDAIVPSFRMS
jgi:hypothetical protein